MTDIHFVVEEAQEGGYIARALGESIFTEADTLPELRLMIQNAMRCHFEAEQKFSAEIVKLVVA